MMLTITDEQQAGRTVLRIAGRFDAVEVRFVTGTLRALGQDRPTDRVELDLSEVTFFDSSALHAILNHDHGVCTSPVRFAVIAASGPVNLVYRLTGHTTAFDKAA